MATPPLPAALVCRRTRGVLHPTELSCHSDDLTKALQAGSALSSSSLCGGAEHEPSLAVLALSLALLFFGRGRNGDALPIFQKSPWIVQTLFSTAILCLFFAGLMGCE